MRTTYFCQLNSSYYRSIVHYITKYHILPNRSKENDRILAIMRRGINGDCSDQMILSQMREYLSQFPLRSDRERTIERGETVLHVIGDHHVQNYLDFGCGDCKISHYIASRLQSGLVCVDLKPDTDIITDIGVVTDQSVDLVTALMSIHHAGDCVLHDLYRVLRPGGKLVVREHNYDETSQMRIYLNLIHIICECADPVCYYSADSLCEKMQNIGLSRIYFEQMGGNNPQKIYHAVYQKS